MKVIIQQAAFAATKSIKQHNPVIQHSQVLQIFAALFGYSTYAALLTEENNSALPLHLKDAEYIIFNLNDGKERAKQLSANPDNAIVCAEALKNSFSVHKPSVLVFDSVNDFFHDHVCEKMQLDLYDSEVVASEMAESNAIFEYSPELSQDFETSGDLWKSRENWSIEDSGTLVGSYDYDGDRVFNSDTILVTGRFNYKKAGRSGLTFTDFSSTASSENPFHEEVKGFNEDWAEQNDEHPDPSDEVKNTSIDV